MQVVLHWEGRVPFKAGQAKRSMTMKTHKPSFHCLLNAPALQHTITPDCYSCNSSRSANGGEGLCTSCLFILTRGQACEM